jgi:hypothetical protein
VSAAARLIPYNPRYLVGLALLQPERSPDLLRRAIALNEHDVRTWVRLGLEAEFERQDVVEAERCYRRATEVSHMFYARSNLANFYYRYQRNEEFFQWASSALQRAYADPSMFFAQIWAVSGDGRFNLSLIPDRAWVLNHYASFLLGTNRLNDMEPALIRALQQMTLERLRRDIFPERPYSQDAGTRAFFGYALDSILWVGRHDSAERVWTQLHSYGWLATSAPSAAAPLTNGNFRTPSFEHGFDWAFAPPSVASIDQDVESSKLRISFNGKEPETCRLLQQYVVLTPSARYRLSWVAKTESIAKNSGLQWRLFPVSDRGPASLSDLVSPDLLGLFDTGIVEKDSVWNFTAPAQPLNLLVLDYARRLGTTRPEGDLSLRLVELKRLPP